MEIFLSLASILIMGAIVGLPLRLIFRKWKDSTVAYLTAAILGTIVNLVSGAPSLPIFILRLVTVTFIVGTLYWASIALFRKILRVQPAVQQSKTSGDYVICPQCGLEQWKGYDLCQKCNYQISSN